MPSGLYRRGATITPNSHRHSIAAAVSLAAAIILWCAAAWTLPPRGAVAELYGDWSDGARRLSYRIVPSLDPRLIVRDEAAPRERFRARWTAVWPVDRDVDYLLEVAADDRATVRLDGQTIITPEGDEGIQHSSTAIHLSRGLHLIVFEYEQRDGGMFLDAAISEPNGAGQPLPIGSMLAAEDAARAPTARTSIVLALLAFAATVTSLVQVVSRKRRPSGAVVAATALALVLLLGLSLRLDALLGRAGPIGHPGWLHNLDEHARLPLSRVAPVRFQWVHDPRMYHLGDPSAYLVFAREMKSFYAAHPREPLFIGFTRTLLPLVDGQDLAVGLASALSSFLSIALIFALGAAVASRWTGLLAALAFAVDRTVIAWSVEGWRDDTFTFFFLLFAWLAVRASRRFDLLTAIACGIAAAGALLTRVTSLAFIVPAVGVLALNWFRGSDTHFRRRSVWKVAAAGAVAIVLAAPYFVSCYRTFGTPLYAIDVHTSFYRSREGQPYKDRLGTFSYIRNRFQSDPVRLTNTFLSGMTTYPFLNKWGGFDDWAPYVGPTAAVLSLIGVMLLFARDEGRLLLAMTAGSMLPYAFTHDIQGGSEWRFTLHVYPVLLVAAALAAEQIVIAIRSARDRSATSLRSRMVLARAAVASGVVVLLATGGGYLGPYLELAEDICRQRSYSILADGHHALLFSGGWSAPNQAGNVISQHSAGAMGTVWLPIGWRRDHHLRLRLDPSGQPDAPRELRVYVNRRLVSTTPLVVVPDRIGAYDVGVPATAVHLGLNRLDLLVTRTAGGTDSSQSVEGIRLWYARVTPRP